MNRQNSRSDYLAAVMRSLLLICACAASSLFLAGCSERRSVAPPQSPPVAPTTGEDAETSDASTTDGTANPVAEPSAAATGTT
ncbi:MAG: hypothetical protein GY903_23140 [Fuerstiella sp.]|nr:hypothetical protein [Fuerstiella sp.]MCP4857389.1 hypothetical protein [Fuerstiella sp.]